MLRKAKEFKSFKLRAKDGDFGKAKEFYFDDKHWTVRYLVVETGGWLLGRQILVSPYALKPADEIEGVLPVNLTKKQIEDSPPIQSDQPVSRQFESDFYGYYGWPSYWYGLYPWGNSQYIIRDAEEQRDKTIHKEAFDQNLRSTNAVDGYHIQATDGEIGHVEDFIIDEDTWSIRYLVVNTGNWWSENKVLISPQWIERVSWEDLKVFISLSRDAIKQSPKYSDEFLTREYEVELHQHYKQKGYWAEEPEIKK